MRKKLIEEVGTVQLPAVPTMTEGFIEVKDTPESESVWCLFLFCSVTDIRLAVTPEVSENTALSSQGQLCLTSGNVRALTQTRPVNQS